MPDRVGVPLSRVDGTRVLTKEDHAAREAVESAVHARLAAAPTNIHDTARKALTQLDATRCGRGSSRSASSGSPESTRRVIDLWGALRWAAHHYPYEFAPTAHEIRGWFAEARLLVAALTSR